MADWIKVENELPEEEIDVLTYDEKNNELRIDHLISLKEENPPYLWACRYQDEMYDVSHWMPLPKGPWIDAKNIPPFKGIYEVKNEDSQSGKATWDGKKWIEAKYTKGSLFCAFDSKVIAWRYPIPFR